MFRKKLTILLIGTLIVLVMGGCSRTRISIRNVASEFSYKSLQKNVLNSDEPSAFTLQILRQNGLTAIYRKNPSKALIELDNISCSMHDRNGVYALSELAYFLGKKNERSNIKAAFDNYVGAVRYSYFFLFDTTLNSLPDSYDPRFRNACDIYNYSLAKTFKYAHTKHFSRDSVHVDLIDQGLDIGIERYGFLWDPEDFSKILLATDYDVKGLSNQYRTFGLGVPLIAESTVSHNEGQWKYLFPKPSFPVTAFLKVNGTFCDKSSQTDNISMGFYDPLRVNHTNVGTINVPLESDISTPLGYYLSSDPKHFRVDITGFLKVEQVASLTGLYMLQPYERGKIPVVMVHGLLSSPMAWIQVFNDLRGDPELRDKYQFWFFLYPTGNPFYYSASQLRDALQNARHDFDPNHTDKAFDEMILVGHSMGGLMSKMMVVDSGDKLWNATSEKPFSDLKLASDERDIIEKVFFFKPLPFVKRVVFIATPHRGSLFTKSMIGRIGSYMIRMPSNLLKMYKVILTLNPDITGKKVPAKLPNSVDALSPNAPEIKILSEIPIPADIKYNSIIADNGKNGIRSGTDGYVPYASSHLEGAESEIIVNSKHGCLENPMVILDIKKILQSNLNELNSPPVKATGNSPGILNQP